MEAEKHHLFKQVIHEMIAEKIKKLPQTQRRLEEIIYQYSKSQNFMKLKDCTLLLFITN